MRGRPAPDDEPTLQHRAHDGGLGLPAHDVADVEGAPGLALRDMAVPVFLPTLVFEIGNGAVLPVVVLTAVHLGASVGEAAFVLALMGVGRVLGDVPAARLANRVGDHRAMVAASLLAVVAFIGCLAARTLLALGVALLVVGAATAVFYLARHSYLTAAAPVRLRARAMSTLAGSHRAGLFVGPFAGAAVISLTDARGAYAVAVVTSALTAVLLVLVGDRGGESEALPQTSSSSWAVLLHHRRLFLTLGVAMLAVGAVRAARQTVLPLWADHLFINAETTSLVFGIAGAVEMLIFYPAGRVMDTHGRLAIAVPSMTLLGGAMMLLPLTTDVLTLTLVAVLMSIGNGIGSGIMMTIGSDVAPADERVRFLGVWRLFSDSGNALGPVLVSAVATLASLAAGIVVVGTTGLLAATAFVRWLPRLSPFATPSSVRAYRERH